MEPPKGPVEGTSSFRVSGVFGANLVPKRQDTLIHDEAPHQESPSFSSIGSCGGDSAGLLISGSSTPPRRKRRIEQIEIGYLVTLTNFLSFLVSTVPRRRPRRALRTVTSTFWPSIERKWTRRSMENPAI
jgi:hypothetical protein